MKSYSTSDFGKRMIKTAKKKPKNTFEHVKPIGKPGRKNNPLKSLNPKKFCPKNIAGQSKTHLKAKRIMKNARVTMTNVLLH